MLWQQVLVGGLLSGGTYAVLALGFALVFGVARILNLTHTAYYMVAAYLFFDLGRSAGLPAPVAIVLALALVAATGMVVYRLLVEPLREQLTAVMIMTVVLAIALQETLTLHYGNNYRSLPPLLPGDTTVLGIQVTLQQLLTLATVWAALGAIWLVLFRTKLGIAIRATAEDRETANLMGMNVGRVAMITVGLSLIMAALAGVTVAPLYVLHPRMWLHPLIIVLAAVILGGIGSLRGSVYAAFILGFTETLVVFVVPQGAFLRESVSMLVMLTVLLIRPEGLFGRFFEGER